MNPNWSWLFVGLLALITEVWSLAMRHDRLLPVTYWLRKLPWLLRVIVLAWLVQHFLYCGSAC